MRSTPAFSRAKHSSPRRAKSAGSTDGAIRIGREGIANDDSEAMSPLEVEIASVVAGGDGLARPPDGQIVFVPGGLPGERVLVEITETKKGFRRAALLEVVEAASARVSPPCPHVADGCGGCDWQHVDPAAQRALKASIVADALRRIAKVDPPEIGLGPDLPATAYRTTVRVAVRDGRAGFRHRRSHDVVAVDRCLVAPPLVDELIEHGRFGVASEVTLRAGAASGERLVLFETDVDPAADDGVALPSDVFVVGPKGKGSIHEVVAGRAWRISARSFFQTRTDGAGALVDAVAAAVGPVEGRAFVDLYAGVGLFAGTVGQGARSVLAVEGSAEAGRDARHNLPGARVVVRDVNQWRPEPADVVVADPSRTGLGTQAADRVAATGAERVALVSCDAASLARDTKLLLERGFGLTSVMLVDLFPQTSHIEAVSRFDRHPGGHPAP
jgi:23S rRNA (uracil1939-C5)-methyltransferase